MIRLVVTSSILLMQVAFFVHVIRWATSMEAQQQAMLRDRRCVELLAYKRNLQAAWNAMHATTTNFELSTEWIRYGSSWDEFRTSCSDAGGFFELKEQRRVGICPNWWVKEKG